MDLTPEEDKQMRKTKMSEMRRLVKSFIFRRKPSNVQSLSQYDLPRDEQIRLVISLEDTISTLRVKKAKAEKHISELISYVNHLEETNFSISSEAMGLQRKLKATNEVLKSTNEELEEERKRSDKLQRQLDVFKEMFVDSANQQKNVPIIATMPPFKDEVSLMDLGDNYRRQSWAGTMEKLQRQFGTMTGRLR